MARVALSRFLSLSLLLSLSLSLSLKMCPETLQVEEEMRHKQDLLAACAAKEQTLQDQVCMGR